MCDCPPRDINSLEKKKVKSCEEKIPMHGVGFVVLARLLMLLS